MGKYQKRGKFAKSQRTPNTLKRVGIFLFILSWILYGIAFVVPFTPLSTNTKVIMASLFVVLGESAFWISCIIAGKEMMKRYRKHLNPVNWFKKSRDKNSQ
ncbi:transporter suffix domain-containing protein [Virgibacillus dakarensis]|uniref:transporter suffix domain-containing protein n=1 Tax=Virgibacillus dakarensis TaxID=1917889 RepID=UPI000B43248C|nr:transporter suffix domain-containing protein [Virgibacillus dakarensis]